MAHSHDHTHSHTDEGFVVEQLCTIIACGALGTVAVLMYSRNLLQYILAPQFFVPVLLGGGALLVMVVIRAISLWKTVGTDDLPSAHEKNDLGHVHGHDHAHHDHDHHDHDHDHDHSHDSHDHATTPAHTHDHDHGHDHGWMPLRCAVLLIPIVLYFCNLPNGSFGAMARGYIDSAGKAEGLENAQFMATEKKDGQALELSFNELNQAAYSPRLRETWSGKEGRIRGFLEPINDHEFRLIRMKMTCCVADAVPLKARIITKDSLTARSDLSGKTWVEVTGVIQFRKLANQDTYVPVLQVETLDNIKVSEPQGNEYEVS